MCATWIHTIIDGILEGINTHPNVSSFEADSFFGYWISSWFQWEAQLMSHIRCDEGVDFLFCKY